MNNSENDDWLHKNDSYQPMQIGKRESRYYLFYCY
jgi:hypothetical protein